MTINHYSFSKEQVRGKDFSKREKESVDKSNNGKRKKKMGK
jgi:hypothetical protein